MSRLRGILAVLTSAFALCAAAREPDVEGLKSYRLPAYTLITHDERAARKIVELLPSLDRVLTKLISQATHPSGPPAYIYLVRGQLWRRYLQPSSAIVGEFVPTRFANYLLITTDNSRLRSTIYHEYTHFFLRTQFNRNYPLWFDEGLAELMTFTRLEPGKALVGVPYDGNWPVSLPIDRVLRADKTSREYLDDQLTHEMHQESWALVHKGVIADPQFGTQLFTYLKAVDNLRPIDQAVVESFGMSTRDLGRVIRDYSSRNSYLVATINFEPPPPAVLGSGQALTEVEALESIANIMLDTGFNPSRVAEVIEAAGRRAPDAPNLKILRMRLAARDRDDFVLDRLAREFSPGTSDPALARGAGLALFERVRAERDTETKSSAQHAAWSLQAFQLLDQSLAVNPDDPAAVWGYGVLAARLKRNPSLATRRLQRGRELLPLSGDLAMAQALMCEAYGESAQKMVHLAETARYSSDASQRSWALAQLDEALKEKAGRTRPP